MAGTAEGAAKRGRCSSCGGFHAAGAACVRAGMTRTDPLVLIERGRVVEPSGCHSYKGRTDDGYYPEIGVGRQRANRLLLGLSPSDPRVARHTCDRTWCINPDHLLAGTQADNLRDMDERGRRGDNRWAERKREKGKFA